MKLEYDSKYFMNKAIEEAQLASTIAKHVDHVLDKPALMQQETFIVGEYVLIGFPLVDFSLII